MNVAGGNFAKLGRLIRCGNRLENGHAPLDDSHPWRGRFVPCRSFRCRGSAEIWPGRGIGRSRGCDVRLPTFIQTPPPTARSTCIGSPASRCALGAAPGGRRLGDSEHDEERDRRRRDEMAEEAGDVAKAERLYRALMKCDPTDAAPPFNLGNILRANGRKVEAEAAFRAATRADPLFAEAWYNLSDLLDEQRRSEAAIDCLRSALRAAPDYADAMFNLALLLQRGNKHGEAAEYWRRYLANDAQSEWAARARRSLKFCEMQIHLSAASVQP
jgi:tetratricopeptide (TPR) repeat protein